jgi:pyrroline-5-carboxylate reductase
MFHVAMAFELGIIGAGNMAEAIARGVLDSAVFAGKQIIATDVLPERRELFQQSLGIECVDDPVRVARDSKVILLALKPQTMSAVLQQIAPTTRVDATIVSIAAGITTKTIEKHLAPRPVVRTMPNTPLMVGLGAVAMAPGTHATETHMAIARKLFEGVAKVVEVREDQLDAVTALSGSGPAYFFYLVEQMVKAGIEMGLDPIVAHQLATQTARGAGKMLATSQDSPAELRRKVTSPNGTTQAAIEHMQAKGLDQIVIDALKAAERRGKELGAK